MKFCGACGAPQVPGDQFCQKCGRAYSADEPAQAFEEPPVVQSNPTAVASSPSPQWAHADDEPFPSWAPIAAGAAVFFAPFISLIVSLVMRSSEQRPSRRSFLKNWAIASGAWLCTGWLVLILVFAAATSHSSSGVVNGKCKNGPDPFNPPSYVSQDGKHWTAIVPCEGGGSITRPARKGEAP